MSTSTPTTPTPATTPAQPGDLAPKYAPLEVEREIAARWTGANAFHAEASDPGEPYAIVIPPPNVTAALHMGHALNNTLQDILTRYHRMLGDNAMWMPGTDHAGIATQTIVDKRLREAGEPGITDYKKMELAGENGREKFLGKVTAWKDEYEAFITNQLKMMGCSCDWDRQRFTMDEVCAAAVREAFFQLFKDGLIYRGKRLVNWDPVSQTALADDEVEMEEVDGFFYYLKYPIEGGNGLTITVATTRPETMLGDTAVAINPRDPRAQALRGISIRLPIVNRVIPLVEDDYVVLPNPDSEDAKAKYATGFLKVTPAHDPNDYEIGRRHNLALINVMAPDASISKDHGWPAEEWEKNEADPFAHTLLSKSREDARKLIVDWFKKNNLLEEVKPYKHAVGHSYRSHVPIEPYLSDQWYVKVTDDRLAGAALRAMSREQFDTPSTAAKAHGLPSVGRNAQQQTYENQLRFYPERYAKTFQQWHENIRDWCISRQLWWGHRIPVWTIECDSNAESGARFAVDDWLKKLIADAKLVADLAYQREGDSLFVCPRSDRGERVVISIERLFNKENISPREMEFAKYDIDENAIFRCREIAGVITSMRQDPDVLDTWFSSGLWPISTLGWPSPEKFPREFPEGDAALNKWNPSTTLCTAREIITLWVSRMVMFNIYFRGCLPFKDVFIHAMIQDGHGQKMSKTLGNGIDPLDIIHSHGSDAMRFTLAAMTTQTQDLRMTVEMVCPHCGNAFMPKFTQSKGGTVAAPMQECPAPGCRKPMTSSYGNASGKARPTPEAPVARNTSEKFDYGRNFANKLWNAVRFALSYVAGAPSRQGGAGEAQDNAPTDHARSAVPAPPFRDGATATADQWILARLARTVDAATKSLEGYEFKPYADGLYDFIWRDFCDWYIEAIKPTVANDPAQQRVLVTVIDAILRLLHPAMPFITEKLWERLNVVAPTRGDIASAAAAVTLPMSELLVKAPWPKATFDAAAASAIESRFEAVRKIVSGLREARTSYQVPPKQKVACAIKTPGAPSETLLADANLIATLANVEITAMAATTVKAEDAASVTVGDIELYLAGLIDKTAECTRLKKKAAELTKSTTAMKGRLSSPAYTEKAPPHLVQQTRDQLAALERELETITQQMAAMGCA